MCILHTKITNNSRNNGCRVLSSELQQVSPRQRRHRATARRRPFPGGRAYICPGERCGGSGVDTTGTETNSGFWGHCAVCAGVLCAAEIRFSRNGHGGRRGGRIV